MANTAMETTEDFQDATETEEIQVTRIWNDEMEGKAVQANNANQDEPQRTTLSATPEDDEPDVPEAIERMMNHGITFAHSTESWKV